MIADVTDSLTKSKPAGKYFIEKILPAVVSIIFPSILTCNFLSEVNLSLFDGQILPLPYRENTVRSSASDYRYWSDNRLPSAISLLAGVVTGTSVEALVN
jgi:hypothetical protein